jgi:nucleoside-diphosphate-sugar epimerase
MLTPGKVSELTYTDWVCDDTLFRRETDWTPRIGLREGMRRMLEFMQKPS